MTVLASTIARQCSSKKLRLMLSSAAEQMSELGIIGRLRIAGDAIAAAIETFDNRGFRALAEHQSDLVRQWACYAVNSERISLTFDERLRRTLPFAADRNMSVREAAWMAFRPHIRTNLAAALKLLEEASRDPDANIRRFAIEVTRPRSVWGSHISEIKQNPELGVALIENVRSDPSRYVQLAAGNWLNDTSKSNPNWVIAICSRWVADGLPYSHHIVKRGLRTLCKVGLASSPQAATETRTKSSLQSRSIQTRSTPC